MSGSATSGGKSYVEGRHFVSPFNFMPEVTSEFSPPKPVGLISSTIRKVIYTLGVRANEADLLAICELLDELGVEEECLNVWWRGATTPNPIEQAAALIVAGAQTKFKKNLFTDTLLGDGNTPMPLMRETVDRFAEAGIRIFNPGILQAPDEDARKRQVDEIYAMAEYLAEAGLEWNATIANCARRDFEGLVAVTNTLIEAGVRRLDLMDSTSALSPQAMGLFVKTYRGRMSRPAPMSMHTHDDFGMATAGTIAAVLAGASPDVALNGVSYRSGFAAMEEVVLALDVLYGIDTGIRLDRFQWAADRLAEIMRFPIPPLKPVVGAHQYKRETSADIAKIEAGKADEGFATLGSSVAPSVTGASFSWVWATQSDPRALDAIAQSIGISLSEDQTIRALSILDQKIAQADGYPKWVSPEDVKDTIRQCSSGE